MEVYLCNRGTLADSRLSDSDMKRLYIMDYTTITLFKDILKGNGHNPLQGKKKGGIKAHTITESGYKDAIKCMLVQVFVNESVEQKLLGADTATKLSNKKITTYITDATGSLAKGITIFNKLVISAKSIVTVVVK